MPFTLHYKVKVGKRKMPLKNRFQAMNYRQDRNADVVEDKAGRLSLNMHCGWASQSLPAWLPGCSADAFSA